MLYSMTGYGEASFEFRGFTFKIELTSLNSRYLDVIFSMSDLPEKYQINVKKILEKYFRRGRITVRVKYKIHTESGYKEFKLDTVKNIVDYLEKNLKFRKISLSLDLGTILKLSQFKPFEELDSQQFRKNFMNSIEKAALCLSKSRENEGLKIEKIFLKKLDLLEREIQSIKDLKNREKDERLKRLIKTGTQEDEISTLLAKMDITEEVDRFRSHLGYFKRVLKSKKRAKGRELEFIIQEMQRELTTISQKSTSIKIIKKTIKLRNIVEQLKEQVRNIE